MQCVLCKHPVQVKASFCESCRRPMRAIAESSGPEPEANGKHQQSVAVRGIAGVIAAVAIVSFSNSLSADETIRASVAQAASSQAVPGASLEVVGTWICDVSNPDGKTGRYQLELNQDGSFRLLSGAWTLLGKYAWDAPRLTASIVSIPELVEEGYSPNVEQEKKRVEYVVQSAHADSFEGVSITDLGTKLAVSCRRQ